MKTFSLGTFRILFWAWTAALTVVPAVVSQDGNDAEPASAPSGSARLVFEGRELTSIPFTLQFRGPLFDLSTMTTVLGVEMIVGPRGESHRLVFKDRELVVGPDRASTVIRKSDGSGQELIAFSQTPVMSARGIRVPLDFFELAFGQELGFDFAWDEAAQTLTVKRREERSLEVSVDVLHQLSTTVEIRFSTVPRYRIEERPGALEINLSADRLKLPVDTSRARSPLVRGVTVFEDRLRIDLADNADVAEPRLQESPEARLIVEVFQKTASREPAEGAPRRALRDSPGVRTIVIDPGHGGSETGAVGPGGTTEKDLALTVARSLERLLKRRLSVRVVLTRSEDIDIPLETRTAIANQNKADLFISIHFNSYFGKRATGAETFFLSREASDQLAAAAAAAENNAGGEPSPESDLQLILWDLAQTFHLAESQRFANLVQEELNLALSLRNRGVKQAPFRVLMGATMPAVLVELGFISNPEEEKRLNSPIYQAELVDALFRAIRRFKTQVEAKGADIVEETTRKAEPPGGPSPSTVDGGRSGPGPSDQETPGRERWP